MKLTQLRYFVTVCEFGTLAEAARILHITQPSISAALKELEEEFGVRLFARQGRTLRLTEAGQTLYAQASDLLKHAENVEQRMLGTGHHTHVLRVGVPPMIGSLILPQIFTMYKDNEDVHLQITEAGREKLYEELRNGKLDLAFLPHDTAAGSEFGMMPVAEAETRFVCSVNNPHAELKSIPLEVIADTPLVMFKSSFFQNTLITELFRQRGITPNVLLETDQLSTVISVVRSDTACGFLFRSVADSYTGICSIPLDPRLQLQISLFWNRTAFMNQAMLTFIKNSKDLHL